MRRPRLCYGALLILFPLGCAGASPARFAIDDDAGAADPIERGGVNAADAAPGTEGVDEDDAWALPAESTPAGPAEDASEPPSSSPSLRSMPAPLPCSEGRHHGCHHGG